jgi:transposase InsO family protein
MDLFGPVAYISIGGNKYDLIIIDDYSCYTWVFFLQDKSETQEVLKEFLKRAQNEFDAKVKKIRSDNDTEFKNTQVKDFVDEEGIKYEFSAPYTPQENGGGQKEESYSYRDGKNHAWWIQDLGPVLGGGNQHGVPCNQSSLPPQATKEDILWAPNR